MPSFQLERLCSLISNAPSSSLRPLIADQLLDLAQSSSELHLILDSLVNFLNDTNWSVRLCSHQVLLKTLPLLSPTLTPQVLDTSTTTFPSLQDALGRFSSLPHLIGEVIPSEPSGNLQEKRRSSAPLPSKRKKPFQFDITSSTYNATSTLSSLASSLPSLLLSPDWNIRHGASLLSISLLQSLPQLFNSQLIFKLLYSAVEACYRDRLRDFVGEVVFYPVLESLIELIRVLNVKFLFRFDGIRRSINRDLIVQSFDRFLSGQVDGHFVIVSCLLLFKGDFLQNFQPIDILLSKFVEIFDYGSEKGHFDDDVVAYCLEVMINIKETYLQSFFQSNSFQVKKILNLVNHFDEYSASSIPLIKLVSNIVNNDSYFDLVSFLSNLSIPLLSNELTNVINQVLDANIELLEKNLFESIEDSTVVSELISNSLSSFVKRIVPKNFYDFLFDASVKQSLYDDQVDLESYTSNFELIPKFLNFCRLLGNYFTFSSETLFEFLFDSVFKPFCVDSFNFTNGYSFRILFSEAFGLLFSNLIEKFPSKVCTFLIQKTHVDSIQSILMASLLLSKVFAFLSTSVVTCQTLSSFSLAKISESFTDLIISNSDVQNCLQQANSVCQSFEHYLSEDSLSKIQELDVINKARLILSEVDAKKTVKVDDELPILYNRLERSVIQSQRVFDLAKNRIYSSFSLLICVNSCYYPKKLGSIVKILIESLKTESDVVFADCLMSNFALIVVKTFNRTPSPVNVVLKNLIPFINGKSEIIRRNCRLFFSYFVKFSGNELNAVAPNFVENLVVSFKETNFQDFPHLCQFLGSISKNLSTCSTWAYFELVNLAVCFLGKMLLSNHDSEAESDSVDSDIQSILISSVSFECARLLALFLHNLDHCFTAQLSGKFFSNFQSDSSDPYFTTGFLAILYQILESDYTELIALFPSFLVSCIKLFNFSFKLVSVIANMCFAKLFTLVPLAQGSRGSNIPNFEILSDQIEQDSVFLTEFIGIQSSSIEKFDQIFNFSDNPFTLRSYQKEGIMWLNFLKKFNLAGILADDMGLGKTLQTLCILSTVSDISLVVAPSSVVHHWVNECRRMFPKINVECFLGVNRSKSTLNQILTTFDHGILVTSYDCLKSHVSSLSNILFSFVVLDEGHLIRNHNSVLSRSVKQLMSQHRLILTGTPIQNHVLELWSLFDFLIPGYFGSRRSFNSQFTRPITALKERNSTPKAQEAAASALHQLHRQLLPFIMRRRKEDVLDDLPPKIITDVECSLTDEQRAALAQLDSSESKLAIKKDQNELKILTYPDYFTFSETDFQKDWFKKSGKMTALVDLLIQTGLDLTCESFEGNHKILIFCQTKRSISLIEQIVFPLFANLKWLRMDGDVPAAERQSIVDSFSCSDYAILILTTSIGGLGLNLQAADTVIMFEHSYNPQEDAQAMDRAHRLGQKKIVNVYRLITSDSLEERVMSLQKFKLQVSDTVVNKENVSLKTMDTKAVLETFASSVNHEPSKEKVEVLDRE
ncbi:hypothetical protein P9112_008856 [Eukaryota sp. TZLM1-RC]